ncbi:hypothetical protein BN2476_940036 [Paraburkholderia piptadeniae]|uniref:Uncharacterized protein n=1 Tax=Paraburkholderia piptadeniae TaxID=1701573 RepID=A0A1N7STI4_9BURK|nr:hypothetical protein BN2476_940036 [Paraburkholderia piptadeniae]
MLRHELQDLTAARLLAQQDTAATIAADDVKPAISEVDP